MFNEIGGIVLIADQSIKVTIETKKKLESLRIIPQDTMDNVINRLLDLQEKEHIS